MTPRFPSRLAHLLNKLSAGVRRDVTTGPALLALFVETRDEEAFAGLVRLYGTLVWGVCQRRLRDPNDAEDALQATFIVLARQAHRIEQPERLAPWLHGVALRVSRKMQHQIARRREQSLAFSGEVEATAAGGTDLREILDVELNRLPEKLRQAFVLCRLEERTLAEAAQLLGCPLPTLGHRLTRATELLRARLRQRGLAPEKAMAGLTMAGVAGMPCATLDRIAHSALSGPPKAVLLVAESVIRGMSRAWLWKGFVIALVLLGAVGGGLMARSALLTPARETPPANRAPAIAEVTVSGRILDEHGKPIPKARVALFSRPLFSARNPVPADELVCQGQADDAGRYSLRFVVVHRDLRLAAWADGRAVATEVVPMRPRENAIERDVRLSRPREIRGQLEAKGPVRKWRVVVFQIGSVRRPMPTLTVPIGSVGKPRDVELFWPADLEVEEGKPFVFRGLNPDDGVRLHVSGPHTIQILQIGKEGPNAVPAPSATHLGPRSREGNELGLAEAVPDAPVYGAPKNPAERGPVDFSYQMPGRKLAGGNYDMVVRVKKGDTKEPLAGAQVWVGSAARNDTIPDFRGPYQAVTPDGDIALPDGIRWPAVLYVVPPVDSPYLVYPTAIGLPPKATPDRGPLIGTISPEVPRGVRVRGVVTDDGGKPVPGARVWYRRRPSNDGYNWAANSRACMTSTDKEGRFSFLVPPGSGYLLIDGPDADGYASETINLGKIENDKADKRDLRVHKFVPVDVPRDAAQYDVTASLRRVDDAKPPSKSR
jgi:RNA polymerase sigma factor (sigma-70 family)